MEAEFKPDGAPETGPEPGMQAGEGPGIAAMKDQETGKDEATGERRRVRRRRSVDGSSRDVSSSRSSRSRDGTSREKGSRTKEPRRRRHRAMATAAKPILDKVLNAALVGLLALVLFGPYMTYGNTVAGGGQVVRQLGYTLVAVAAVIAVRGLEVRQRLNVVPLPLLLAVGWCGLSVAWAIEPSISVRRFVLMAMTLWTVFVIVQNMRWPTVLATVRVALVVMLVLNYAAVLLDPVHSIHGGVADFDDTFVGSWYGVMGHKNQAGLVCALTIVFFAFDRGKIPRIAQIAVIAASCYFIWRSHSKTSLGVCMLAIALAAFFSYYRYQYRSALVGGLVVVATLLFGLQNFYLPAIGHLINTPMTFTGRTEIWNAVWRYIAAHPVLGAGYGSFWNIGPASPIFTYGFGWVQEVSEGHNGYLDLLAAIGPFGFLLVIAGAYVVPIVRLIGWRQSQRDTGALLMAMMIFIIGHNFTESSLFDRDTIGQVFLMLTIAGICSVNPRSRSAESGGSDLFGWANRDEKASSAQAVPARG